jgi:hypothetical protein
MASATFEDHPTDPDKMILRKPRLDQGADYERGFVDGMQYQMQSSVDKAVNATPQRTEQVPQIAFNAEVVGYIAPQRTWVGLTDEEIDKTHETHVWDARRKVWNARRSYARAIEAKLKEKNT